MPPIPDPAAGDDIYAEDIEALATEGAWTPQLRASTTNPNLGGFGAVAEGVWYRTGGLLYVEFHFAFGGGPSAGSGFYMVTLPPEWPPNTLTDRMAFPGNVRLRDDSTTDRAFRTPTLWTDGPDLVLRFESQTGALIGHNNPWTWAQNDTLSGTAEFRI